VDEFGCITCSGSFSIALYAVAGSFEGSVYRLPEAVPATTGEVLAAPYSPGPHTPIDSEGHYDFAEALAEPRRSNNWALPLVGDVSPTISTAAGYGTYDLSADGYQKPPTRATTESSKNVPVDLVVWSTGFEELSRCEPPSSNSSSGTGEASQAPTLPTPDLPVCAPCAVGLPVSVTTGAVHFEQTDTTIPGLGPGLRFVRSYNSQLRASGQYGVFGPGWNHVYEQRLTFPTPALIMLRRASGDPAYFQDNDGNLTYEPSIPFTKSSTIVKQAGGTYLRSFRSGGSETYDSAGHLTGIVDISGHGTTLGWTAGRLQSITDAGGRQLTLTYEGSLLAELAGPAGLIATYTYDSGRLQSVTYADNTGYRFTYDATTNQLVTISDPTDRILETHTYYGDGRAATSEIAGGQERLTLSYGTALNPQALQTTVTDARGNVATYEYNRIWGGLYVTKLIGPCTSCGGGSETQEWRYDNRGRVKAYTDGAAKTTTYEYYDNGDLWKMHDAAGGTTIYTYEVDGRLKTRQFPNNALTRYVYDPPGLRSITESVTATVDRQTSFTYNAQNKVEYITDPRGKQTRIEYYPIGDVLRVTDPLQHVTTFTYDAMGRRKTHKDPLDHVTTWDHDAQGRVRFITLPDTGVIEYRYDLGGRRKLAIDQLQHETEYTYDDYGRLETIEDPQQGTTRYEYDSTSNLKSITDARNHKTSFGYDGYNRVNLVTYPDQRYETFTYDGAGRMKTRTDRKQVVTTYTYDALGQLKQKVYSDGTSPATYTYNSIGRMLTASNATDNLTWTYDLAGQALTEASSATASTLAYSYDPGGNRLTLSINGSQYFTYEYRDDSRLERILRGPSVFQFDYDEAGRRKSLQYPSGSATTTYDYDAASRVTHVDATGPQWPTGHHTTYLYDLAGNRYQKTTIDGVFNRDEVMDYDPNSRLKRVTLQNPTVVREAYDYDAVGNRLQGSWAYDASNRLYTGTDLDYTYDANGNRKTWEPAFPTSLGNGNSRAFSGQIVAGKWIYNWDAENRLTYAANTDEQAPVSTAYEYDALGRRKLKTVGSVTTKFIYDGDAIVRTKVGAIVTATYTHGPRVDEPLLMENAVGIKTYLHGDALGSVVASFSGTGSLKTLRSYDSFGNFDESGSQANFPYAFTGREWDSETGLYYYRARYYDPRIGRFISEDPIGFSAGVNFYAYALDAPTRWRDPFGLVIGDYPPAPPGYDPSTWNPSQDDGGDWWIRDPSTGQDYRAHPEDKGHWRHWDKPSRGGSKNDTEPRKCTKPWPGQKRPPYGKQSPSDPSGDAPPWKPPFILNPMGGPSIPFLPLPGYVPVVPPVPIWIWPPVFVFP
jgi:RHS repeat-associated protein